VLNKALNTLPVLASTNLLRAEQNVAVINVMESLEILPELGKDNNY
jgi:hypothetical protein